MSFADCIRSNKELSDAQKNKLLEEYTNRVEKYKSSLGSEDAAASAAASYMDIKKQTLIEKNLNKQRDALMWVDINKSLDADAAKIAEFKGRGRFQSALYTGDPLYHAVKNKLETAYTRTISVNAAFDRKITDLVEKYRSKFLGLTQHHEGFKDVLRGMDGSAKQAENNAFGAELRSVLDNIYAAYKQAGGIMGFKENYKPVFHNPKLVGKQSFEQWFGKIRPLLDEQKMINPNTALPYTDKELTLRAIDAYESIRTNGLSDLKARVDKGKRSIAKRRNIAERHSDSTFFVFKDTEAYLQYNQEFGYGDDGLFKAFLDYIGKMSRDIGTMQEFGPNPDAQISRMLLKMEDTGEIQKNTVQGMYNVLAGRLGSSAEPSALYKGAMGIQKLVRIAFNGLVPLSTGSDAVLTSITAKMNGLDQTKALGWYIGQLNPFSATDRRIAAGQAFITQAATGHSLSQVGFLDDGKKSGALDWLGSVVSRASGLTAQTDAVRNSLILSAQQTLAEFKHANVSWAKLPKEMREAFDRWDITKRDYDKIMKAEFSSPDGKAQFIDAEGVARVDIEAARKLDMWFVDMSQTASNEPRLLTMALSTGAALGHGAGRVGSLGRLTASTALMYKSFSLTVMMNHVFPALRTASDSTKGFDRFGHLAYLTGGLMFTGAATNQLRDMAYGKEPRDMSTPSFWVDATAQSGLLGPLGDVINPKVASEEMFGSPVVGLATDGFDALFKNPLKDVAEGRETSVLADSFNIGKKFIPGMNLWYTKLLTERLLSDNVNKLVDNGFYTKLERNEQKMRQEKGQEFWWRPVDNLPK